MKDFIEWLAKYKEVYLCKQNAHTGGNYRLEDWEIDDLIREYGLAIDDVNKGDSADE